MFKLLLVGIFAKFHQCAASRLGVQECDIEAFGTFARRFVDKANTFTLGFGKSVGNSIFYGKSNVLYTATATIRCDVLCYGTVFGSSFKQLYFSLTHFKESGLNLLVGNFFDGEAFYSQNVLIERYGFFKACYGNTYVFDMRNVHN